MIALPALLGLGASSLVEYLLHRFFLHRTPEEPHIQQHHRLFNGNTSYASKNASFSDIASSPAYLAANFILYAPAGGWLFFIRPLWGIVFFLAAAGYTFWVEYAHLLFHRPAGKPIEKTALFRAVKEHHRIHHVYYKINYGIGATWWDHVLKTRKKLKNP